MTSKINLTLLKSFFQKIDGEACALLNQAHIAAIHNSALTPSVHYWSEVKVFFVETILNYGIRVEEKFKLTLILASIKSTFYCEKRSIIH